MFKRHFRFSKDNIVEITYILQQSTSVFVKNHFGGRPMVVPEKQVCLFIIFYIYVFLLIYLWLADAGNLGFIKQNRFIKS